MTWTHTRFIQFLPNSVTPPSAFVPHLPPPALLAQSVSIVLEMKVPLCVWRAKWCMVWPGTDTAQGHKTHRPHTQLTSATQSAHTNHHQWCHRQILITDQKKKKKKQLTVQQAVLSLTGLLWPVLQRDGKHQPMLLWRPHVPTNTQNKITLTYCAKMHLNVSIIYIIVYIGVCV